METTVGTGEATITIRRAGEARVRLSQSGRTLGIWTEAEVAERAARPEDRDPWVAIAEAVERLRGRERDARDAQRREERARTARLSVPEAEATRARLERAVYAGMSAWSATLELAAAPVGGWGDTAQALGLWEDRADLHSVSADQAIRAAYVLGRQVHPMRIDAMRTA